MNHFTEATTLALIAYCLVAAQPGTDAAHEATSQSSQNCAIGFSEPPRMALQYRYSDCIAAKFGLYIKYSDGNFVDLGMGTVDQVKSYCQYQSITREEKLALNFDCGSLSLKFSRNFGSVFVSSLEGQYELPFMPDYCSFHNYSVLFEVNSDHYYKCDAKQAIVLISNNNVSQLWQTLFVYDLRLEAFMKTNSSDFSKVEQPCSLDQHSSSTWWIYPLALLTILAIVVGAFVVDRMVRRRISAPSNEVIDT